MITPYANSGNENAYPPPKINLPLDAEGVTYFIDEAGSKGSLGKYFVTGGVRTTDPDRLSRAIKSCRDRNKFTRAEEIKFSKVSKNSAPILAEIFQEAVASGCTFGAFVLDKRHFDPWSSREQWRGHLFATDRLLRGMITRREVGVVMLDYIDVPTGVSYGDELASSLNNRFGNKRVATAVSLDSRTCAALQVADLLASAVFHSRKKIEDNGLEPFLEDNSPKARLSKDIASALGLTFFKDCSTELVKVQTSHKHALTKRSRADNL